MRKITITLLLLVSLVSFSQEPFRYDTIRVSDNDSRNIHQLKNRQQANTATQNRNRARVQANRPSVNSSFDPRKLRYGINFGLNFSNNYSLFRLAPQVGYQFNKYVMTGVGVSYYHSKRKYYYDRDQVTHYNNSLGANAFAYLYPVNFIAFSLQPELNYIWRSSKDNIGEFNKTDVLVPSVVIGAGLRFGRAHAMLYYDLVQDTNSPYSSGLFYGISVYF
ncbi:MAG: hypothetical protein PHN55_05280 [Dysgonamonadaceae bacterium]|nr:hypothetical protein [Dysgonamonadaceae bacterium]